MRQPTKSDRDPASAAARAGRTRPCAVPRTRARADPRRPGHRRRPGGLESRHRHRSRASIELATPDHPWVGRGGIKLAHALDTFGIAAPAAGPSTSAPRPAASPTCCCSAARATSSRSTSATASSTGGCAPIRASSCREDVNARDADAEPTCRISSTSSRSTSSFISLRHILPAVPPLLAPRRRHRRAGEAAVRGRPRGGRQRRAGARSRRPRGASWPASREAAAAVGLSRVAHDAVAHHRRHRQPRVLPAPDGDARLGDSAPAIRAGRSIVTVPLHAA